MNNYLLDTHSLLWFQGNSPKMSLNALHIIQAPANTILFSQINLFEITIKQKIQKLPDFKTDIEETYHKSLNDKLTYLQILNSHLYAYQEIPLFQEHKDPFDRLLIATALVEDAIIITIDKKFDLYHGIIKTIW